MNKFTFKTENATGRYRSFYGPTYNIKYKKMVMGDISSNKPHTIRIQVMKTKEDIEKVNNNKNCGWKWIAFKKEFNSVDEAKKWLSYNVEKILNKFELYLSKD